MVVVERRRGDLRICLILALLSFLIYNANLRLISSGDNYPARYLPFGILRHGTLLLDRIEGVTAQGHADPYWIIHQHGHALSLYPVTVPLVITPLYIPAVVYLDLRGWTDQRLNSAARLMEKLSSSLIASASVALMYLLLRRRTDTRTAILLTVAYAFGTNTWMIGSQALWQHGLAELLLVVALYILTGPCSAMLALCAGGVCGLIACTRPPDAILVIALGVYGLRWARGKILFLAMGTALPLALLVAYNLATTRNIAGGYSTIGNLGFFRYNMAYGILGLLFSPARGLFIFTPFLLFLPFILRKAFRDPATRNLTLLLLLAIAVQICCYARLDWRGGAAWGPRWLTEILPLVVWMMAPGVSSMGRTARAVFILAICASISIQAAGAFWYTGSSDEAIMSVEGDPNHMKAVWDFRNTPFISELRHRPAPRDLLLAFDGYIDVVKYNGHEVNEAPAGTEIEVEGWALADHRTPAMVTVTLLAGHNTHGRGPAQYPLVGTTTFLDRPDVTVRMDGAGPCGWHAALRTDGFDPGEYVIEVTAQDGEGGELRVVAQRRFKVLAVAPGTQGQTGMDASENPAGNDTLEKSAYNVAKLIRTHQQAAGYWLTSYTQSWRFENPTPEMNTFLTSMIVDMLDPVSARAGLGENLERARLHLAAQIEANGLVRYHGRPDSPTIPSLGCVITPDADDTALVWRIAGNGNDARLPGAIDILKSYRTPEGLYRTWLAPVAQYISIDPGADPDPADVGIQMNMLMFLAKFDPPAAGALHDALQKAIAEQKIWVYYEKAPLLPLLRQANLRALGYPLQIPQDRLQTSVPGQEVWVTVCRLLARYLTKETPAPSLHETQALLTMLAANDFSTMRHNPPLFYHNDLTAKASRFYWSEDFGYALWIRLYVESTIRHVDTAPTK